MNKIGIICAGDKELEPFIEHINLIQTSQKALLKFHEGTIKGQPIVALYSGVCKVNAAIATQILIDSFNVDIVINAGTAGGMHPKIKLFDTIISTKAAYHDVDDGILTDFHPWMSSIYFNSDESLSNRARILFKNDASVYFGCVVTGEKFISDDMRESINIKYNPLSVDIETASISHVCYSNNIPFISIRTITDTSDHSGIDNFEKNCSKASEIAKDYVLRLLNSLTKE